jgi:hypothetical protein
MLPIATPRGAAPVGEAAEPRITETVATRVVRLARERTHAARARAQSSRHGEPEQHSGSAPPHGPSLARIASPLASAQSSTRKSPSPPSNQRSRGPQATNHPGTHRAHRMQGASMGQRQGRTERSRSRASTTSMGSRTVVAFNVGHRWERSWILSLGTMLGCPGAETDRFGDGLDGVDPSPAEILCLSTQHSSVYDSPAWSPDPIVGTAECPAVDGRLVVALSTVEIRGSVTLDDSLADPPNVWLIGKSNEGVTRVRYDADGAFSLRAVPGRYDVAADITAAFFARSVTVFRDLEVEDPVQLDVQVPGPATVTGIMTLDGEAAPDPYGHIFVRVAGDEDWPWFAYPLVAPMDRGSYSISLAPGSYDFLYTWCNPAAPLRLPLDPPHFPETVDLAVPNAPGPSARSPNTFGSAPPGPSTTVWMSPCHVPDHLGFEGESESPKQKGVPIASNVLITGDRELDLDVPTVRFSGSITVENAPVDALRPYLGNSAGTSSLGTDLSFDERVVVGTYAFYGASGAPPFDEALVLDRDTHVERSLRAFSLDLTHDERPSILDLAYATGVDVRLSAYVCPVAAPTSCDPHDLPMTGPLTVFAGPYVVAHEQALCWPDYDGKGKIGWRVLSDALHIETDSEIDLAPQALARVALDYTDLAWPEKSGIGLFGAEDGLPRATFRAPGGRLVAHGLWPIGRYRVRGELVDIVDGTTIRLVEASATLDVELLVDGTPTSSTGRFRVVPADEDLAATGSGAGRSPWRMPSDLLSPGRYLVMFNADADDPVPANSGMEIGCVTIEG